MRIVVLFLLMAARTVSGQAWPRVESFHNATVLNANRVLAVPPSTIWVTTGREDVLLSRDDGRTWKSVPILKGKGGIGGLHFANGKYGWAAGSKFDRGQSRPCILRTLDGGETWSEVFLLVGVQPSTFSAVDFVDERNGTAVGEGDVNPIICTTHDGGDTWSKVDTEQLGSSGLSEVRYRSRDEIFAVGSGEVLHSSDGGSSWRRNPTPVHGFLHGLAFSGQKIFVTGGWGRLLESRDAGTSWRNVPLPAGTSKTYLWSVTFSGDHGWVCGDKGTILTTSDQGATWSREESVPPVFLRDVAVSPGEVIIVGDDGVLLIRPKR